jgi:hypothetical protein
LIYQGFSHGKFSIAIQASMVGERAGRIKPFLPGIPKWPDL